MFCHYVFENNKEYQVVIKFDYKQKDWTEDLIRGEQQRTSKNVMIDLRWPINIILKFWAFFWKNLKGYTLRWNSSCFNLFFCKAECILEV
jgi:hypothetical protein